MLEINAAARFVDYNTFGSNFTWKAGLRWEILEGLALRGTYSTAFRGPNVAEMFAGNADSFPLVSDPCSTVDEAGEARTLTAEQIANCAADGVPADHEDTQAQLRARLGGNPDAGAETANIMTAGVVYEGKDLLEGLSVTLDYYSIEIDNAITTLGADVILSSCYSQTTPDPDACAKIERNATSNTIINIIDTTTNAFGESVSGLDFAVKYGLGTGVGRWGFGIDGTYLLGYDATIPDATNANGRTINGKGVYDLGVWPELRMNAGISWSMDEWGAGLNARFIGGFEECQDNDCTVDDPVKRSVESNTTMDLYASYTFDNPLGTTAFTMGMNNVLDQAPAVIYNGFLGTSDASTYDFVGRYVYARLTQSF